MSNVETRPPLNELSHNIIKKHFLRVAVKKTDRNHTNILFRAYAVKECCSSFTEDQPNQALKMLCPKLRERRVAIGKIKRSDHKKSRFLS